MREDGSGTITIREFENQFHAPRLTCSAASAAGHFRSKQGCEYEPLSAWKQLNCCVLVHIGCLLHCRLQFVASSTEWSQADRATEDTSGLDRVGYPQLLGTSTWQVKAALPLSVATTSCHASFQASLGQYLPESCCSVYKKETAGRPKTIMQGVFSFLCVVVLFGSDH